MSFNAPGSSWSDLHAHLSGRSATSTAVGGDSPTANRKRDGYVPPADLREQSPVTDDSGAARVPYAELHCHSNFSFLDGASFPEQLVEEAARLRLDAITLTDHDGLYGAARFADAARDLGVRTAFGVELSLGLAGPQNGIPDPAGQHLLAVARGAEGYRRMSRVLTGAHLRGEEKGRPVYDWGELVDELRGNAVVLSGCRKGAVRQALTAEGAAGARRELELLVDRFGPDGVAVELFDQGLPEHSVLNDILYGLAGELGLPTVATNAVHYARPANGRLAAAMAAVRARRSLDDMDGWLPPGPTAHLRSGQEMGRWFRRFPGAVQRSAVLALECAFDLNLVAPRLPPFDVPAGYTEDTWLRELTMRGARRRYGTEAEAPAAYRQLEHELVVIAQLDFPGYFLIVHSLVEFCRDNRILCQGRGSAANSAVCYALGITNADPIRWELLFERFLAAERDGPPDIDLDIESGRREEVIQHVYSRFGRRNAALVANVISYRPRSAVRDMAKALGFSQGQQDAWSKHIHGWDNVASAAVPGDLGVPELVLELADQLADFPRHLGIHPGGMVICDRPVSEVCPVEWARMDGRTVLQWDKDDCASVGLVKFDLLGLGMLSAIHHTIDFLREHQEVDVDLAHLDLDDHHVYDMLCRADTVGVFQVESRAQMATLPRLKPRTFWDLAVEVALVRPGPIQGGSVHPYIARRNGERWEHDHPLLAKALDKTLGVTLFQEQVMQIAMDVADFTAAEADALRRAMGAKRSTKRMEQLRDRFYTGAAANGITGDLADKIFLQVKAFSGYGFPQSHALSFAHIVFASAWLKCYYPAAFCAGLLKAQPMGFYSPQSLVADARRHGVHVYAADINVSAAAATVEADPASTGGQAVRLGLAPVRTVGDEHADRIVAERDAHGPYTDLADLVRRVGLSEPQMEALATAGALGCFGRNRRETLWSAGAAARDRDTLLPGSTVVAPPPALPGMTAWDLVAADLWATGVSDTHPIQLLRQRLNSEGVTPAAELRDIPHGTRVLTAGAITHRQRPGSAGGVTFLNLEDETGMSNIVCSPGLWTHAGRATVNSAAIYVRGIVEQNQGVLNLIADRLTPLSLGVRQRSRDFR